ncbi:MAG: hypothetical protein Q4D17_09810, partial [Planctomycetia bacterium]|nr:hypothetical protein [Planctomycetia bacterium]
TVISVRVFIFCAETIFIPNNMIFRFVGKNDDQTKWGVTPREQVAVMPYRKDKSARGRKIRSCRRLIP